MWESSRTRARTHVSCIGRRILNHCATREAPKLFYIRLSEEWKVIEKCDRTKEYELRIVKWQKLSKAYSSGFLLAYLYLWK